MTTFASDLELGALDEWLSQRSAKPSTAVRIRQAPPSKRKAEEEILQLFYLSDVYSFDSLRSSTLLIT